MTVPGKHAPESPRSFYLSLARAAAGAVGALALVIVVAVVAVNSRGEEPPPPAAGPAVGTSATPTATPTTTQDDAPEPNETPRLRRKSKVSITVLNGTGKSGLAARVTSRLDREGYATREPGNAEERARTTVYYRSNAAADARAFLDDHPEFKRIKRGTAAFDSDALLVIVLGTDYERND